MAGAVRTWGPADYEGWDEVVIPIESHDLALSELLKLGDSVEILELSELRQLMVEAIIPLSQRYGFQTAPKLVSGYTMALSRIKDFGIRAPLV